MGYSEKPCRLCGTSFNMSRRRLRNEPGWMGWTCTGDYKVVGCGLDREGSAGAGHCADLKPEEGSESGDDEEGEGGEEEDGEYVLEEVDEMGVGLEWDSNDEGEDGDEDDIEMADGGSGFEEDDDDAEEEYRRFIGTLPPIQRTKKEDCPSFHFPSRSKMLSDTGP